MSKSNPQNALKATIDRMVEKAIREILPEVMNEVLLKTLTTINETRTPAPRRQAPQPQPRQTQQMQRQRQLAGVDRSMSLREALSADTAGVDYYEQAEQRMVRPQQRPTAVRPAQPVYEDYDAPDEDGFDDFVDEQPAPTMREQAVAQRISQLPQNLQALAEESFRVIEDDGGEMWEDDEFAPQVESMLPTGPNLNIDRAAKAAGVDFSRAAQLMNLTEKKAPTKIDADDFRNEQQWKMQQLERRRRELDAKKVG